jgi:hypothetical protein
MKVMRAKKTTSLCSLIVLVGLLNIPAHGQSTTGSIYGEVTDSTGAAVPSSTVSAKDLQTGLVTTVTSNGSGEYVIPNVKPSNYEVTGTASGFKTQNETGVTVSANQNVHVVFTLAPGAASETVDVVAGVTLVDTRGSALAETIEQDRIQNLPTLDRSTYDLAQTIPGVSSYTADTQTGSKNGAQFSVNDLPQDMTSFYLDGGYNNTFKQGGGNKIPDPDAIQEFRVITSNFDAEFGRAPGAVANVITRSGSSHFHGNAYEYLRNDILNARPYFQAPGPRQPYKQNQFGGTLGGPILKQKLFFFASYEELLLHQTANINAGALIVPTAPERMGDFSKSTAKPTALPAGTNCGTAAAPKICAAALDPVAQNVLKYVPLPDANGISPQQTATSNTNSYQGLGRLDYNGFKNHSIEAMIFYTEGSNIQPTAGGNQIIGYAGIANVENQMNGVLADNWTVNSRAVNSLRIFYTNNKYINSNLPNEPFLADLGSTAPEGGIVFAPPRFVVTGDFTAGTSGAGPNNNSQTSFGLIDTATLSRGHHQLKVGGSYVWNKFTADGAVSAGGNFTFSNNSSVKGSTALADFLLGRANAFAQASVSTHRTTQYDPALYVQDDWQASNRFTLNLGLRWEMFPPHCCEPHVTGTFIAGQQSTVVPSAPLGLVYQGDKNVAPGLLDTSLVNFSPRFGFAYDVFGDGKTSLRGGFGIFYQSVSEINFAGLNQLPFSLSVTTSKTPSLVAPYAPGVSPFPFVYNPAAPRFADNASTSGIPLGTSAPYVYEYNLTVERQLNATFALRVGYVGNATHNNLINIDVNAPIYAPEASTTTAGLNCRRPYQPYLVHGTCNYAGYSGSAGPDPTAGKQFGAISLLSPRLDANYNSLQASLRGRIGTRFNMLASYVWGKGLDNGGTIVDNTDLSKDYGVSAIDISQRFVVSYTYRFGDAKVWGWFGRDVVGGWRINGVTTLQTGSPFTVTSGTDTNLDGNNNDRANVTGDPYSHVSSRHDKIYKGILKVAAFSIPTSTTNPYGTSSQNEFVGPGAVLTNLSLFKEFPIHEGLKFQFRAESFNVFGNVNLNNPRTNYSVFSTLGAGQEYITGAGNPRIMQFAAKLIF